MNGVLLDYRLPVRTFSLGDGACRLDGALMLRASAAPNVSTLYLDGVLALAEDGTCAGGAAAGSRAFRGDLVQWRMPAQSVLARAQRFLSADITAQVDLLAGGAGPQAATLTLLFGNQTVWSTLIGRQAVVTLNSDIDAGLVTIKKGAVFKLVATTPVGGWSLVAQDLKIVGDGGATDASGVLADWPAPLSPATSASERP